MKAEVFNKENKKVETMELPERIFGAEWNPDLVHQVSVIQSANSRQILAHAKGRGEVKGGGRKPWKQKGTGRARHGSIRSPLWKGGGVTFGPTKERIFAKKINKKMKQLALFSVLSKKLKDNELRIIDRFDADVKKTKEWGNLLKNMADLKYSTLLISVSAGKNIHRATANIKNTGAISPLSLNVNDLLRYKNVILDKEAVEEINKHYK